MKKKFVGSLTMLALWGSPFMQLAQATESQPVEKESKSGLKETVEKVKEALGDHLKISGFILGRAQYSSNPSNFGGFDIRMLRFIGSGNISKDFNYRFQMEFAGSPRILDAWLTWKRYDFFQIRAGQQKRCFTYENPWSPVTLGMSEYAQVVQKLTGYGDRVGEPTGGGRDVGIVFMGDLIKGDTHHYLHYDLGVYNGNGINKADNNKSKDVIGSLHVRPLKPLQIGGGYWIGKYGPQENMVDRKRWTIGLKYDDNKYLLLSEYISSKGKKLDKPESGEDADGWYVTGGVRCAKKLKVFAKYDVYRDDKNYETQTTRYHAALNWEVHKNIILQASYFYTDDNNVGKKNYNTAVAQMFVRF